MELGFFIKMVILVLLIVVLVVAITNYFFPGSASGLLDSVRNAVRFGR